MTRAHRADQLDERRGRDGAHQAEPQRGDLGAEEILRLAPRALHMAVSLLEERLHLLAELGEVGIGALAMEQGAAELALERLDGAGERRLRDRAALGRAGEVQLLAEREEIANLVQLHGGVQETTKPGLFEMPCSYRID